MQQILNQLKEGNNLEILKALPENLFDLIYLDPPFLTNRDFKDKQKKTMFSDKYDSIDVFMDWFFPILKEVYRVLKITGILVIHCDYRTNAYIRIKSDELFGYKRLINEIYWKRNDANNNASKRLNNIVDTIYMYSKGNQYTYNEQHLNNFTENQLKSYKYDKSLNKYYKLEDLTVQNRSKNAFEWRGVIPKGNRGWKYSLERLEELFHNKLIKTDKQGKPLLLGHIRYVDEIPYKKIDNLWCDLISKNNTDYPTQKPLILLERIVKIASNEGDLIGDFFCGSGTMLVAAKRLRRNYLGCDENPDAISLAKERLEKIQIYQNLHKFIS